MQSDDGARRREKAAAVRSGHKAALGGKRGREAERCGAKRVGAASSDARNQEAKGGGGGGGGTWRESDGGARAV